MIEVGIFLAGIVTGVAACRYGIGLGFKAIYQAKEDEMLNGESSKPIEQDHTEALPVKQENTEVL